MNVRHAGIADVELLLPLMQGYYRDDKLEFVEARARATLLCLLTESRWGTVYVLEKQNKAVGYIAICLGFSLELGGVDAIVDEMYVEPEFRGVGVGSDALQVVIDDLAAREVRALHLEVDAANAAAQQLYARLGFGKRDRYFIMTRVLSTAPA